MEIRRFGVGGRIRHCEKILGASLSDVDGSLVLLPIPTTRDNVFINSTETTLDSVVKLIDENTVIAGYGIPKKLADLAAEKGGFVFDASFDEKFLLENARLTANGALGYILTHFTKDIADMKIGIVGYGRIGSELTKLCLLFGAKIRMFTAREQVAMELCAMGIDTTIIGENINLSDIDVLINTTPKRQFDEVSLGAVPLIIDLASGSIFDPSERLIKLSSIPDAFYPESAGRLYAESVLRFLLGDKK